MFRNFQYLIIAMHNGHTCSWKHWKVVTIEKLESSLCEGFSSRLETSGQIWRKRILSERKRILKVLGWKILSWTALNRSWKHSNDIGKFNIRSTPTKIAPIKIDFTNELSNYWCFQVIKSFQLPKFPKFPTTRIPWMQHSKNKKILLN